MASPPLNVPPSALRPRPKRVETEGRRRLTRGIVDPADLALVFGRFESLADGLMGIEAFAELVRDLRLGLRDAEVRGLFSHLAEDVAVQCSLLSSVDEGSETDEDRPSAKRRPSARGAELLARASNASRGEATFEPYESPLINVEQFLAGIRRHRFLRRIVSHYVFPDLRQWTVPPDYDWTKPTCENYGAPLAAGCGGDLERLRGRLDASWHGNYVAARRAWQDAAVHRVALAGARGDAEPGPTRHPWLVYTCGPMGAGKGWVMNWMSQREVLPLRRIVHVDPDRFKQLMPEWLGYARRSPAQAGTLCHRESGTLAELAQELAMEQRCHVWVDGSLRDFDWYAKKLAALRRRFPAYRVALFYVHAHEDTVRRRVAARAKRFGERDVPEDVLRASLAAPANTLRALTPHVDFIARIRNEGPGDPQLEAMETVDTSGDWAPVARRFGGGYPGLASGSANSLRSLDSPLKPSGSVASSLDALDSEPPSPRTPTSDRAPAAASPAPRHGAHGELAALHLQADADKRTIAGLRAALEKAERALRDRAAEPPPALPR